MKRRELIRILEEMGCVLVRHGGSHDWYRKCLFDTIATSRRDRIAYAGWRDGQ
ncbi:MAG: type II toxin-antitoxin system HicA family toxin [Caldilineales bacterium]|nr:type II toxin-antitoxin system HicA family toxin [Caldilineales bacterium]MCW5858507.1 type II toxin-antitoxin system HicA family toxin [Caldilineales bacterium]